jgi:hypothetical protein
LVREPKYYKSFSFENGEDATTTKITTISQICQLVAHIYLGEYVS